MYELARPLLFRLDPERAHELALTGLSLASHSELALRALSRRSFTHDPRLEVRAFGLSFPNPLGLAAGLDKNGVAVPALAALGFGALELGSVTAIPQPGNPRPRLYRLPADEALINRMGFNNRGAGSFALRLAKVREAAAKVGRELPPIGVNVGKSRVVEAADADADYRSALESVWEVADYLVLNVSSPNTPGLRSLQEEEPLTRLLVTVREIASRLGRRPVLLKLSPDQTPAQLEAAAGIAEGHEIAGLIATNTTTSREGLGRGTDESLVGQAGGLSGRPLSSLALAALRTLRAATELPLVSVGGLFSAADVIERLENGACMVQLYTSFIYKGPGLAEELSRGLLAELKTRGLGHISELAPRG